MERTNEPTKRTRERKSYVGGVKVVNEEKGWKKKEKWRDISEKSNR